MFALFSVSQCPSAFNSNGCGLITRTFDDSAAGLTLSQWTNLHSKSPTTVRAPRATPTLRGPGRIKYTCVLPGSRLLRIIRHFHIHLKSKSPRRRGENEHSAHTNPPQRVLKRSSTSISSLRPLQCPWPRQHCHSQSSRMAPSLPLRKTFAIHTAPTQAPVKSSGHPVNTLPSSSATIRKISNPTLDPRCPLTDNGRPAKRITPLRSTYGNRTQLPCRLSKIVQRDRIVLLRCSPKFRKTGFASPRKPSSPPRGGSRFRHLQTRNRQTPLQISRLYKPAGPIRSQAHRRANPPRRQSKLRETL